MIFQQALRSEINFTAMINRSFCGVWFVLAACVLEVSSFLFGIMTRFIFENVKIWVCQWSFLSRHWISSDSMACLRISHDPLLFIRLTARFCHKAELLELDAMSLNSHFMRDNNCLEIIVRDVSARHSIDWAFLAIRWNILFWASSPFHRLECMRTNLCPFPEAISKPCSFWRSFTSGLSLQTHFVNYLMVWSFTLVWGLNFKATAYAYHVTSISSFTALLSKTSLIFVCTFHESMKRIRLLVYERHRHYLSVVDNTHALGKLILRTCKLTPQGFCRIDFSISIPDWACSRPSFMLWWVINWPSFGRLLHGLNLLCKHGLVLEIVELISLIFHFESTLWLAHSYLIPNLV